MEKLIEMLIQAKKDYNVIKEHHASHRLTYLEELASALATQNKTTRMNELQQLRLREEQQTMFRRIKRLQGDQNLATESTMRMGLQLTLWNKNKWRTQLFQSTEKNSIKVKLHAHSCKSRSLQILVFMVKDRGWKIFGKEIMWFQHQLMKSQESILIFVNQHNSLQPIVLSNDQL